MFFVKNQIISKAYFPNKAVAIVYLSLRKNIKLSSADFKMNLSILITAVGEWDRILNYTYNNSSGLPTLTSLVTMVNIIQENLVFDDIIVYFIPILSFGHGSEKI